MDFGLEEEKVWKMINIDFKNQLEFNFYCINFLLHCLILKKYR